MQNNGGILPNPRGQSSTRARKQVRVHRSKDREKVAGRIDSLQAVTHVSFKVLEFWPEQLVQDRVLTKALDRKPAKVYQSAIAIARHPRGENTQD